MSSLNMQHIIEGYTLSYSLGSLPERTGERKRCEILTSYKMSKRELMEEAERENFDISSVRFSVQRI